MNVPSDATVSSRPRSRRAGPSTSAAIAELQTIVERTAHDRQQSPRRSRVAPDPGAQSTSGLVSLRLVLTTAFVAVATLPGLALLGTHHLVLAGALPGTPLADHALALSSMVLATAISGGLGYLVARWLCSQIEMVTIAVEAARDGASPIALSPGRVLELRRLAQACASLLTKTTTGQTRMTQAVEVESRTGARVTLSPEERPATVARGSNDGLWDWDLGTGSLYCSPRWHAIVGIRDGHDLGDRSLWLDRIHPDDLPAFQAALDDHLQGRIDQLACEARMRGDDGAYRWTFCRGMALRGMDGAPYRIAGSLSDISEQHEAEARRLHESLHDPLTGLANRSLLLDRIGQALRPAAPGRPRQVAVLFMDVDRFKVVNESLGHAIGDDLLVATAQIVQGCVRDVDTVARLGGDELMILVDGLASQDEAVNVAERVREVLQQPISVGGHDVFVTASIGIALSTVSVTGDQVPEDLLRDAEAAMYRAKELGRDRHVLFDPSLHGRAIAMLELESDFRMALERDELSLHYQPIVGASGLAVQAVEALIRWNRPDHGPISPAELIEFAEASGLIVPLGDWVLRRAIDQMRAWQVAGVAPERIAVNLSARQLQQAELPDRIAELLARAGLEPRCLELELTERVVADEDETTVGVLQRLRELGLKLAVDDFGTGYSSLAYLTRFPVSTVKVDRAFLVDIQDDPVKQAIVQAVTTLSHAIGMHVVAEGIETAEQLDLARSLGCDEVQGFLVSRPLPPEQATLWLGGQHTGALLDVSAPAGAFRGRSGPLDRAS